MAKSKKKQHMEPTPLLSERTITTGSSHGFHVGETISIPVPDNRKWKRFVHWVLFRPAPTKPSYLKITSVTGNSFTVVKHHG